MLDTLQTLTDPAGSPTDPLADSPAEGRTPPPPDSGVGGSAQLELISSDPEGATAPACGSRMP
jgi:hypothetical protein